MDLDGAFIGSSGNVGDHLMDQWGNIWVVISEHKWQLLRVSGSAQGDRCVCRFWSFVDVYKAKSQILEDDRPASEKRYFGGVVGQKLSPYQLMHVTGLEGVGGERDIITRMQTRGLTTMSEYGIYEDGVEVVHTVEDDLAGKTLHKIKEITHHVTDLDRLVREVFESPFWGLYRIFTMSDFMGYEDTFFANDKVGVTVMLHSMMTKGVGECRRLGGTEKQMYFVNQNTWEGAAEECRVFTDACVSGILFDVKW